MKSILFAILFLLVPKLAVSQVTKTNELILSPDDKFIYLDSTNQESKTKNYVYIRVIKDSKLKKKSYAVQEYYRSGEIRMEGTSETNNGNLKEGIVTYYYKNTNKKSLTNYVKGRKNGINLEWYENGSKKSEGEYIEDEKKMTPMHKINQFWDANGLQKVVDGNGFFEDKDENESEKGEVKNGFKDGVWEGSLKNQKITYKETYKNGKLISGESVDKDNITYNYTEIETKPEYKSGVMDFNKYVARNYRAPNVQGLKGKVYVTFVVDVDGKIVEPRVLRDIGYGTGEEAIRVLKNCDEWTPGEQRGRKVRCSYSLPISIQSAESTNINHTSNPSEMTRNTNPRW
ncbi:MAG TPA: energy transducer TonB [Flavobacterium alvei]|nr:energy transducer TonB [Flavobacterium alvei]